jgi:hypothetical protein
MNPDMEAPMQTLEQQMNIITLDIKHADALKRLQANPDFELLYGNEGKFVKDYTMTQLYNMANYTAQSRVVVHENMIARSIFMQFNDAILDEGRQAIDKKAELAAMEK